MLHFEALFTARMAIAQGIGFLALFALIIGFQNSKRERMIFFQILASTLFGVHFFLLGAYTGSYMTFIGAVRGSVFINKKTKSWARSILWLYLFICLFIAICIYTWQGYISLLPLIGMILASVAYWLTNPKHIRLLFLGTIPPWMAYNAVSNSYAGVITEILLLISTLTGIIRLDIRKKVVPN